MDNQYVNDFLKSIGCGELYVRKNESPKILVPISEGIYIVGLDAKIWSFGTQFFVILSDDTKYEITEDMYNTIRKGMMS